MYTVCLFFDHKNCSLNYNKIIDKAAKVKVLNNISSVMKCK